MYSVADTLAGGFPHSDIFGSKNATVSPKLFAGCHVLHRLLSPRHSPGALNSLKNPYAQTPLSALRYETLSPTPASRHWLKTLFPANTCLNPAFASGPVTCVYDYGMNAYE